MKDEFIAGAIVFVVLSIIAIAAFFFVVHFKWCGVWLITLEALS